MRLLEVTNVTKDFGGVRAVDRCSFNVEGGEIVGLIGPNGSGKTTLLNCVMSIYKPTSGEIYFNGDRITGLKPHKIARKGIGKTYQITRVFKKMTVLDNLLVIPAPDRLGQPLRRAKELLEFVGLYRLRDSEAEGLSYGQQKLLEFVRVLMLDPALVMLDEPAAGVHPAMVDKLLGYIRELRDQGKTFILVEHNMPVVMGISDRVIVLNHGVKIAEDAPEKIQSDKRVLDAYLGEVE